MLGKQIEGKREPVSHGEEDASPWDYVRHHAPSRGEAAHGLQVCMQRLESNDQRSDLSMNTIAIIENHHHLHGTSTIPNL